MWFALPFVKQPQGDAKFSVYFRQEWAEARERRHTTRTNRAPSFPRQILSTTLRCQTRLPLC